MTDITAIVNVHAEGTLAHRTLLSVQTAARHARSVGLEVEMLIVADLPDDATRAYLDRCTVSVDRLVEIDAGNLSEARNAGVAVASGQFVAFCDGDDLMERNWLVAALRACRDNEQATLALHPEYTLTFGETSVLGRHLSSSSPDLDRIALALVNHWTAAVAAPRSVFLEIPFDSRALKSGFPEDWQWVAEVVSAGGTVEAVPDTCVFIRRRGGSLLSAHVAPPLLAPTTLLDALPRATGVGTGPRRTVRLRDREVVQVSARAARGVVQRAAQRVPGGADAVRLLRRLRPGLPVPESVRRATLDIHDIEPRVSPEALRSAVPYDPSQHVAGDWALRYLVDHTPRGVTHVLLVPWLSEGGSDLVTLHYARALAEVVGSERVVVVATENRASTWSDRLPTGCAFVDAGRVLLTLAPATREHALATYLLQTRASVIHNLNSRVGYATFERYGREIAAYSRLFASAFCEDVEPSGSRTGYPLVQVPQIADHLTGILSDNQRILDLLVDGFGIDPIKTHLHYQPTPSAMRRPTTDRGHLSVLWAGRLDRQKRPDVVVRIAAASSHLPIRFHVYGSPSLDGHHAGLRLRAPNVVAHGGFSGFDRLPLDEFDAFLLTSAWEGMPNVLLEAAAAGLAIVASPAGGVPEFVEDGVTGLLVADPDDVRGYVDRLDALRSEPRRASLVGAAQALLTKRHSWQAFTEAVARVPGYLDGDVQAGAPPL